MAIIDDFVIKITTGNVQYVNRHRFYRHVLKDGEWIEEPTKELASASVVDVYRYLAKYWAETVT